MEETLKRLKHKSLVNYFYTKPYKLERHFRPLQKEFSLGHGRLDIIGKDKDGCVCLVEVKTRDSDIPSGKRQIRGYQSQLANFLGLIGFQTEIRAIVATPNKVVDVGRKKSFVPQPKTKMSLDIPTSREIFGLRTGMNTATLWTGKY